MGNCSARVDAHRSVINGGKATATATHTPAGRNASTCSLITSVTTSGPHQRQVACLRSLLPDELKLSGKDSIPHLLTELLETFPSRHYAHDYRTTMLHAGYGPRMQPEVRYCHFGSMENRLRSFFELGPFLELVCASSR